MGHSSQNWRPEASLGAFATQEGRWLGFSCLGRVGGTMGCRGRAPAQDGALPQKVQGLGQRTGWYTRLFGVSDSFVNRQESFLM